MFQQLELTHFRQHEKLQLNFEKGVVALRGRNEAGKTTVLEGIAYAMFGATGLREPLDDVVTWGRKTGDLKVKLDFYLNGVDYCVTRSKSGAELRVMDQVRAVGQKEVSRYIETLLGASADVCTKLMLANQDDIKGALSKGPSAAIELIEALSNLGVIDTIISLVQDQLPCGTTVAVASRIATLEEQLGPEIEDNTGPLAAELEGAQHALDAVEYDRDNAKTAYDDIQPAAVTAQAGVDHHQRLLEEEARATVTLDRAQAALQSFTMPTCPDEAEVERLRKQVADAGYMQRAIAAAEALGGWESVDDEHVFDGPVAACTAALDHARQQEQSAAATAALCRQKIASYEAQKITQSACGLCGKDLNNVPEVVEKNRLLHQKIDVLGGQLEEALSNGRAQKQLVAHYEGLLAMDARNRRLYTKATEFSKLVETTVPCSVEWTGPEELVETGNPDAELATAEVAVRAYHTAQGRLTQLEQAVANASEALLTVRRALTPAEMALEDHQQVLNEAADRLATLNACEEQLRQAQEAVKSARHALESAQAVLRERKAARKRLEDDLAAARRELSEMDDNNALIKFLRECRPLITDQLWGIVTATVSSYFSDIRGTQSVVTRSDNGFKVDGHNVAGLSGSTKDALGLAIRMALTRTFLPNASFLILDEAAAGCDDERETNMLGVVAAGGFEQVLLISHADIVDSFATQVVQL